MKFKMIIKDNMAVLMLLIMEAIYFGFIILSRSMYLQSYMINDYFDGGMDYYNMLALLGDGDPYCKLANYPAMCFLILKFFYHVVPLNIACSDNGNSASFFRNYLPTQLPYMILIIIIILITYNLIIYFYKKNGIECSAIVPITLILSGPMMFAIERGNFILIAFVFSYIYIALYDNSNKYMRIIGYISLAIAASIKIYPAIFGILTLLKRRYKETLLLLLLGIVIFIMPFFAFNGLDSLKSMLDGIAVSSELQGNFGCGYNFSLSNMINIITILFSIDISNKVVISIKICTLLFCLIFIIASKEEWKKIYFISLIMIWTPEFSYTYTLIFLIIPFVMLLVQPNKDAWDKSFLGLFVIALSPYALPILDSIDISDAKFPLTLPTLIINIGIVMLAINISINSLMDLRKSM